MNFGALQTHLFPTMTLELTDYMTHEQNYQKLKVLGEKNVPIIQTCHRNYR